MGWSRFMFRILEIVICLVVVLCKCVDMNVGTRRDNKLSLLHERSQNTGMYNRPILSLPKYCCRNCFWVKRMVPHLGTQTGNTHLTMKIML